MKLSTPKVYTAAAIGFIALALSASTVEAFCGFYVAKADTKLFNKASKVVMARHDDKTVLTMANDYQGDLKEFAIVIPVPTFIERKQIHVTEPAIVDHLDAYTSPRLVEYFDPDPCSPMAYEDGVMRMAAQPGLAESKANRAKSLGVTIEAQYQVGEYDILILSAKESDGLETWLNENGYKIPKGANKILGSYIKQKLRFFVAKVNLKEQAKLGFEYLRPLQVAYETPKFILPIRLGTINADGPQELFIFTLTKKGRVETTNYRTVKLPTGMDIPLYVKDEFDDFYRAMFSEQVKKDKMRTVFLEYAWDMNWCDPCAADPLSDKELRELGVFWNDATPGTDKRPIRPTMPRVPAKDVFVTRLHVRYTADKFPEDLRFQETADRENFQGRYVLRHPWTGNEQCEERDRYEKEVEKRREQEAQTLARLTGWDIGEIRHKMKLGDTPKDEDEKKWYEKLWGMLVN